MKKVSIIQTIDRTNFKKVVNYYLNGRGKVSRIGTFNAGVVIFDVVTNSSDMLFHLDSSFHFQSAIIRDGQIHSTWAFSVDRLKYVVNTINYFNRFENDRIKMNFPVVTLRGDYSKLLF